MKPTSCSQLLTSKYTSFSDFDIKVINLETKKQKCFLGHQAPVLSVSLDPNDEFLVS